MRWQYYMHEEPKGIYEDLTRLPLDELYKMQKRIEKRLAEIRAEEPSAKRKNEQVHRGWFFLCQMYIDDLIEVRDAICSVKEQKGKGE